MVSPEKKFNFQVVSGEKAYALWRDTRQCRVWVGGGEDVRTLCVWVRARACGGVFWAQK